MSTGTSARDALSSLSNEKSIMSRTRFERIEQGVEITTMRYTYMVKSIHVFGNGLYLH